MAAEQQAFVDRGFDEDLHLLQELSDAKVPAEVWNAWSRSWHTAAKDYGAEYSAIAKLATGCIPCGPRCGPLDRSSNPKPPDETQENDHVQAHPDRHRRIGTCGQGRCHRLRSGETDWSAGDGGDRHGAMDGVRDRRGDVRLSRGRIREIRR